MVTQSGSQPTMLSQRQVDEFASGKPSEESMQLLRTTRFEPVAKPQAAVSRPISLEGKEIQEIVRCGVSPDSVRKRIATSMAPAPEMQKEATRGNAPTLKPPEPTERD